MLSITGTPTTTPTSTTPTPSSRATEDVAARVDAARADLLREYAAATGQRPTDNTGHAVRARRLALLAARDAGWWTVLIVATRGAGVAPIWREAAIITRHHRRERARFWRDTAADWQARADRRPTSDAAGALSNWAELGVTP